MGKSESFLLAKKKQRARIFKLIIAFFAAFGFGTMLALVFISIYVLSFADEIFRAKHMQVLPVADGTSLYEDMKQIEVDKKQALEEFLLEEKLNARKSNKHTKQRKDPVKY